MILFQVKLENSGDLVFENQNLDKFLSDVKFLPKPYVVLHEKPYTYAACHFVELYQNCVTLVRCFSYFHDQDHVHIPPHMLHFYTGS